jgi:acyl-CoA thioesterase I
MPEKKPADLSKKVQRTGFLGQFRAVSLHSLSGAVPDPVPQDDNGPRIRALLTRSQPVIWLFAGDSITQGALHTSGWRSYPELFAERVRWELCRLRDVVINVGVSGDTMGELLNDQEWRIFQFRPHVISLMMGTNDCAAGMAGRDDFRGNLNRLADAVEARQGLLLLHTPNLIYFPDDSKHRDLPAYIGVTRDVAKQRKLMLVDHYAHWQKAGTTVDALGRKNLHALLYWLNDGSVHPNEFGHRQLANLLFERLGIYDPTSRTCRLFIE